MLLFLIFIAYAAALFGGYVADRVIGYQRRFLVGGVHGGRFVHDLDSESRYFYRGSSDHYYW